MSARCHIRNQLPLGIVGRMQADFGLRLDLLAARQEVFIDRRAHNGNYPTVPPRLLRLDSPLAEPRRHT